MNSVSGGHENELLFFGGSNLNERLMKGTMYIITDSISYNCMREACRLHADDVRFFKLALEAITVAFPHPSWPPTNP